MLLRGPFERFVEASPVSVMMRGIIENQFHPERLQRIFEENAVTQYTRTLPFATVAEVMGEVVFNVNPSVNAVLKDRGETLPVSVSAFYQKLNGVEPNVSAVLVRDSATQLAPVIRKLGLRTPMLPGYNIRILDGNHFAATEHRLLETRRETAAPLPGQALVVLDPDVRLAVDVIPCEDGHAQERSLLDQVLPSVRLKDLWVADRNFCTLGFLFGIARHKGRFLIRHHANMPLQMTGRRKLIGQRAARIGLFWMLVAAALISRQRAVIEGAIAVHYSALLLPVLGCGLSGFLLLNSEPRGHMPGAGLAVGFGIILVFISAIFVGVSTACIFSLRQLLK